MKEFLIIMGYVYIAYNVYLAIVIYPVIKRRAILRTLVEEFTSSVNNYNGKDFGVIIDNDGKLTISESLMEHGYTLQKFIEDDLNRLSRFPFLVKYNPIIKSIYSDSMTALEILREQAKILEQKQSA